MAPAAFCVTASAVHCWYPVPACRWWNHRMSGTFGKLCGSMQAYMHAARRHACVCELTCAQCCLLLKRHHPQRRCRRPLLQVQQQVAHVVHVEPHPADISIYVRSSLCAAARRCCCYRCCGHPLPTFLATMQLGSPLLAPPL